MKYYFNRFSYRKLQKITLIFNLNINAPLYPSIKRSKYFRRYKIIFLIRAFVVALQRSCCRSVTKVLKGFEKVAAMDSSNSKDDDDKKNDKFAKNLDQSNVNPVGINNSPPPTSSTNRRENFEPHTLDTGYESHPFFDRLHGYLETNTVYDIWRPNEQEHQTLQHNNSITCLPISAYHQDFNTSASQRSATFCPAAEQAWNLAPEPPPFNRAIVRPTLSAPPPSTPATPAAPAMPVMSSISQSFSAMHFSGCFSRAHRPYSAIAPSDSAFAASTSTFNAQRRSRNSGNFESRPSTSTSTSSNQTFSRQQQHHETPHPSSSSSLPPSRQNSIRARGHTRRQQKKR